MILTYRIYNTALDKYLEGKECEDVYIHHDGRVGFIDTVGRFIEDKRLILKDIQINDYRSYTSELCKETK